MNHERRRSPRYQLIAEAEIVELRSKVRLNAKTSDVSLLGQPASDCGLPNPETAFDGDEHERFSILTMHDSPLNDLFLLKPPAVRIQAKDETSPCWPRQHAGLEVKSQCGIICAMEQ
jgi:hypothetical protein